MWPQAASNEIFLYCFNGDNIPQRDSYPLALLSPTASGAAAAATAAAAAAAVLPAASTAAKAALV